MPRRPSAGRSLAIFLTGAGAMHFVVPRFYDAMIPDPLPGRARTWTLGSGAVELAVAAAVANPATRPLGARAATALFVAVFPANLWTAWQARTSESRAWLIGNLLRLPLQAPLVLWAHRVATEDGR